jgi:hypothetical protein
MYDVVPASYGPSPGTCCKKIRGASFALCDWCCSSSGQKVEILVSRSVVCQVMFWVGLGLSTSSLRGLRQGYISHGPDPVLPSLHVDNLYGQIEVEACFIWCPPMPPRCNAAV